MFHSQYHLRGIKFRVFLQKKTFLAQVEEEFTTREILHHQKELGLGLERTLQCHYKWMRNLSVTIIPSDSQSSVKLLARSSRMFYEGIYSCSRVRFSLDKKPTDLCHYVPLGFHVCHMIAPRKHLLRYAFHSKNLSISAAADLCARETEGAHITSDKIYSRSRSNEWHIYNIMRDSHF